MILILQVERTLRKFRAQMQLKICILKPFPPPSTVGSRAFTLLIDVGQKERSGDFSLKEFSY